MCEMRSALASRIYKNGVKQSASGAVSPDPQWSIPMFRIKNGSCSLAVENSTAGRRKTLDWLVERSVAQLFHQI